MPSTSFYTKLSNISRELGMNPRDLLLVMYFESGVNPAAVNMSSANPDDRARGLIQFMPDTLKGMGLSKSDIKNFGKKSGEEQLDYVKRYVQSHRGLLGGQSFTSATQYYVANFYPIALKKWHGSDPVENANVVVVDGKSKDPRERIAYSSNKVLDYNKDGRITVSDITNTLLRTASSQGFQNMLKQFNIVAGAGNVSENVGNIFTRKKYRNMEPPASKEIDNPLLISFMNKMTKFLDHLTASKNNNYIFKINSINSDFTSELEFAKILSLAIKEELDGNSEIYTNGSDINIECNIDINPEIIKKLCASISDTFEYATKTIGGIKCFATMNDNTVLSNYQKLDIQISDINYRKFRLKFIKGNK